MTFIKNDSELLTVDPRPEKAVDAAFGAVDQTSSAANVYNRVGRLLTILCKDYDVEVASVISLWLVQSGGRLFMPRRAHLHFEVEKFYATWGRHKHEQFDVHFKFGSRNQQEGAAWENHEYREDPDGQFRSVHHNQNSEYAALTMARTLAGDGPALMAVTLGGCLLSAAEFTLAGYRNSIEMFDAFQESERAHVLGFFNYCLAKPSPNRADLLRYLKNREWALFARHFPTDEQTPIDPERLRTAYTAAKTAMQEVS